MAFASLLERLLLTPSRNRKIVLMMRYFRHTPDPDRGIALAALTGALRLRHVKPAFIRDVVMDRIDPVLWALSYDYVGDMAETVSLIWPGSGGEDLPGLADLVETLDAMPKDRLAGYLSGLLDRAEPKARWALIKLATGGLRVGVSARLAKTALAEAGGLNLQDVEEVWHGVDPPYTDLFAWMDGRAPRPRVAFSRIFHPMMLANPLDDDRDFSSLDPDDYVAEWKWDGVRVQIVGDGAETRLFSRTGEDISHTFLDLVSAVSGAGVLDGELLGGVPGDPLPFNRLQQRLNRKTVIRKHLVTLPAFVMLYDMLFDGDRDIRDRPQDTRRKMLERWLDRHGDDRLCLSARIPFTSWTELEDIRRRGADERGHEGVMIKHRSSLYVPGRPRGPWFKWKRDPKLVDAVLMYAQRGHGKRSSFYSDFTFGLWREGSVVPIGKAYFGFTDAELRQLDAWVRKHTINRFGPVREVAKGLVLEVAFDSVHTSPRHKSGVALRFPRISRIRWDKPVAEADSLNALDPFLDDAGSPRTVPAKSGLA